MTSTDLTQLIDTTLEDLRVTVERLKSEQSAQIAAFAGIVLETIRGGGTLFFAGNGGSAADAQHIATEYVIRFRRNRIALAALAITTDTSLITAAGNDLGFDTIFARQVEALARPGDLVILHSTSGNSPNLLLAAEAARTKGVRTAALLAKGGGALKGAVDFALVVPTDSTSHAQEMHLAIEHLACQYVEEALGLA